eukprot:TRINITY_DN2842_c0_g1_i4.p1 TRINITY_DN2842_c0_g1~~TRINITY_DN2842_c0_g1_i4.p1  ORF type:complete len:401 (-),score=143.75 TRINITY_DN2842_c0_g1_i4:33-1235(-)
MAKEVRVVEGKEPKHFLTIWTSIINSAALIETNPERGYGSLIVEHVNSNSKTSLKMWSVYGKDKERVRVTQIEPDERFLNSRIVFIVYDESSKDKDKRLVLWIGSASLKFHETFAQNIAEKFSKRFSGGKITTVKEGKEPSWFWDFFGTSNKDYYIKNLTLTSETEQEKEEEWRRNTVKMWECTVSSGLFRVSEIRDFCQDDLLNEDVFLLDATPLLNLKPSSKSKGGAGKGFGVLYLWIGELAHEKEVQMGIDFAVQYADLIESQKPNEKIEVKVVKKGNETEEFIGLFFGWDLKSEKGVGGRKEEKEGKRDSKGRWEFGSEKELGVQDGREVMRMFGKKYKYEELVRKEYVSGLDVSRLEMYLEDDDFEKVFRMTRDEWENNVPEWKKMKMRKETRLF